MNAARHAVAADVLAAAREHDASQSERLARFRNVEPETAELLGVLVRAARAERVLELGTSNGYSTIWLADAAEATGGRVVSVDIDAERITLARDNLERAGLDADLRVADAAEALAQSSSGTCDLVFLDAERGAYVGYWPDLEGLRQNWHRAAQWLPTMDPQIRTIEYGNWRRAVERTFDWTRPS